MTALDLDALEKLAAARSTTQSGCAEELQPARNGKGEGG